MSKPHLKSPGSHLMVHGKWMNLAAALFLIKDYFTFDLCKISSYISAILF